MRADGKNQVTMRRSLQLLIFRQVEKPPLFRVICSGFSGRQRNLAMLSQPRPS